MYIAVDRSSPAAPVAVGCASLRQLEADIGEVKRLYVDSRYRGHRTAERLMEAVIQRAVEYQYPKLRLDTLARLKAANRLYERMGFYTIPAYNDCPLPGAIWFEKDLSAQAGKAVDSTALH